MTYSIAARDPSTGAIGIAVASRFFACGAMVPYVSARSAFASQAFINPLWGLDGLQRLDKDESPDQVLADLIAQDQGQANRQAHMIAPDGRIAQHTGAQCVPWAGHCRAENVSIAGNMLAGPAVIEDMLQAWQAAADQPLVTRLLTAMEAGEAAGGDKRGRQAAGLVVHEGQPYPALDLRVDDHADPLGELRRLLAVSQERFALFRPAMPTRENPSGMLDRGPLDQAIAERERHLAETGIGSQSQATPPAA
ncbi:hypothetical protein AIOL_000534 [Candidatus Rhodobacter oscarellae]|uniref:Major pilin protein fimA n=1 Tax=Candidatus Rhodobacter oscarellae TaxID=1675527 RepID=A0A0J9ECJ7_9RHOB|nr:DUF1028 domain-containing protein [Candidatus Rhodobacter lobularis]KMW60381.1 hypothetical protein AIOL_000534 [Candidatus Rhodobacter lobularis]